MTDFNKNAKILESLNHMVMTDSEEAKKAKAKVMKDFGSASACPMTARMVDRLDQVIHG